MATHIENYAFIGDFRGSAPRRTTRGARYATASTGTSARTGSMLDRTRSHRRTTTPRSTPGSCSCRVTGSCPPATRASEGTIRAIEKNLTQDGFVLRYKTQHTNDGLSGSEGAFLACSFWLVDAYAYSGRRKEAEALFERLLSLRNDLGLLAEEYEPKSGRLIGNFPQAFSHLALIHSASVLNETDLGTRPSTGAMPRPQTENATARH